MNPMRLLLILISSLSLLPGRAGILQHRDVPIASAQTADEAGQLPVGRVLKVERFTCLKTEIGPVFGGVPNLLAGSDGYYRQTVGQAVGLMDGQTIERDEFMAYKVGECVAIRNALVVPALTGECQRT